MNEMVVTCPICGENLARIDREHAQKHGFDSLRDFRDGYGIGYTTLEQRSRQKMRELYNIDSHRWAVVYTTIDGEMRYVTKQYVTDYEEARSKGIRSATKFPLGSSDYKRHFSGRNPIAIFAYGTHSRYFGFDIDSKENAATHALRIIKALETEGIPREYIHVSFSGSKGYHIEIFTEKHIKFEQWAAFGEYIIDSAGLVGEPVEYRPEKGNGRGWKLPLTYHHKTGFFAGYCDIDTLDVYNEQSSHDYLFAIRPLNMDTILPILLRALQLESEIDRRKEEIRAERRAEQKRKSEAVKVTDVRLFRTAEEKNKSAADKLIHGLIAPRTRWITTREIALYLWHEAGNDRPTIRETLIEWTALQIETGLAETPIDQCIKEIDDLLEWVEQSTDGYFSTVREIEITRAEVEWVLTIKDRTPRDLLWAILLRSKAYARKDGHFYTSDRDIQKLLNKPTPISRQAIAKWRRYLVETKFIYADVPKSGYGFHNRKATTYRLLFEQFEETEVIDAVTFDDEMDCRELLREISSRLLDQKQLRKMKLIS